MLLDYFEHTNSLESSSIEETFEKVRVTLNPDMKIKDYFPKLFDELKTISSRDRFELFIEIEGTSESISDSKLSSHEKINSHIKDFSEDSDYEIELNIWKECTNSSLSIYFFDAFEKYLDSISWETAISAFSKYFGNGIAFEVFSKLREFGSKSIYFHEAGNQCSDYMNQISASQRQKKLSLLVDNATTSNFELALLPEDFYLSNISSSECINRIFGNLSSIISLVFLSNASRFLDDGSLSYKVSGYKTLSENYDDIDFTPEKCKLLYKIYTWAYEGGSITDKIGLVRNVLSIHLDHRNRVKYDHEVWEAIQSSYQIYLKENVQSYLEIKNKISEFVIESSSKTHILANDMLTSFKSSIVVFLTFILSVVIVNGLKDSGVKNIFSDAYMGVVFILCVISVLWREMTSREVLNQFENASSTVKSILQLNYAKVLMGSEIDQCIDPVVSTNRAYIAGQVKRYSRWWLAIILVFFFTYGSLYLYFGNFEILK